MSERLAWRGVDEALQFLFNPDRAPCDRPPAARLADERRGDPGQLSGLDGAATTGSALAMLEGRLTTLQLVVLAARYAPSKLRCECTSDCCSGWKTNPKWRDAIDYLAHEVLYRGLTGLDVMYVRYVTAVLMREYGKPKPGERKIVLTDVGTDLGLSLGSCTNYRRAALNWLLRVVPVPEAVENGKKVPALPKGIEVEALVAAEETLRLGGFIQ